MGQDRDIFDSPQEALETLRGVLEKAGLPTSARRKAVEALNQLSAWQDQSSDPFSNNRSDILDAAGVGFCLVDSKSIIRDANSLMTRLTGRSLEALIGCPFDELVIASEHTLLTAQLQEVKRSPRVNLELTLHTSSGQDVPVRVQASRLRSGINAFDGACLLMTRLEQHRGLHDQFLELRQRFDFLVKENPAVVFVCGAREPYALSYISENVDVRTGYSAEEFLASPYLWVELIHPQDQKQVLDLLQSGEERVNLTFRHLHRSGHWRWNEIQMRGVSDSMGEHWIGSWVDVTKRRLAEQALRDNESRFRSLIENVNAIVWKMAPRSSVCSYVSPHAEAMLGYSLAEWYAPDFWEDHLHPEDRDRVLSRRKICLGDGKDYEDEYRLVASDGREVWFRDMVRLSRDALGRRDGLSGFMVDISDTKAQEEELLRSREQLEGAQRIALIGSWRQSPDGKWLMVSTESSRLFEWGQVEKVAVEQYWSRVHPDDLGQVLQAHGKLDSSGEAINLEYRIVLPKGDIRWIHELGEALPDPAGRIIAMAGSWQDITVRKNAESALHRWKQVFENAEWGIAFTRGLSDRLDDVNPAFARMFGYPRDQLVGMSLVELAQEQDSVAWARRLHHVDSKGHLGFEAVLKRAEAGSFPALVDAVLVTDPRTGTRYRVIGLQDLTLVKETQTALQLHQARTLALLENSDSIIWSVDRAFRLTAANSRFAEASSEPDILARLESGDQVCYLPGFTPDEWRGYYQRVLAGEQFAVTAWHQFDDQKRFLEYRFRPVRGTLEAEVEGVAVSGYDLTGYKRAQEELQLQEARLKGLNRIASSSNLDRSEQRREVLLLGAMHLGMEMGLIAGADADTEPEAVFLNERVGSRFSPGLLATWCADADLDADGLLVYEREPGDPGVGAALPSLEDGTLIGAPLRVRNRHWGFLAFVSSGIRADGFAEMDREFVRLLARWIGSVIDRELDNRELLEAKESAERANSAKSVFLASMSHELRTPLNSILGNAQLLQSERKLPPEQQQQVEVIESSGRHLLEVICDILDLSRIEAGHMELVRDNCRIHGLLSEITQAFRVLSERKRLDFHVELDSRLPEVILTDGKWLRQILFNLLGNAMKFTERGRVDLRVRWLDGWLECEVEDTGAGIPTEQQQVIFDPFTQLDRATFEQGTGLGLPITRRLVNLMNGQLDLKSAPGEGSCFQFRIPIHGYCELASAERLEQASLAAGSEPTAQQEVVEPAREVSEEPPNMEDLQALQAMLRKGSIDQLEHLAKERVAQRASPQFFSTLLEHAGGFRLSEIRREVEDMLEMMSPDSTTNPLDAVTPLQDARVGE